MKRSCQAETPRPIRPVPIGRALAAALVLALGGCGRDAAPPLRVSSAGALQRPLDQSRRTAIVDATERVAPAVVSINVTSHQRPAPRTPWDMFFVPDGSDQLVQSFGTGFVIRSRTSRS